MNASDKTVSFVGLYDIECFINHKGDVLPENSVVTVHDSDSNKDFFILGDGKSTVGELELQEIGHEPFPKHSLDFELIEQKDSIISSVKEIVSNAIDEKMKSFTDNDSEINQVSTQHVQSLLRSIKRYILRGIDNV